MRRTIPGFLESLTGSPYGGEITAGERPFEGTGWVMISATTDLGDTVCGRAGVGWLAGRIELNRNAGCPLAPLVGHEIGHAMGFFHVSGQFRDLMQDRAGTANRYSDREVFHARLAYSMGRAHPYADGRRTATQAVGPRGSDSPATRMIECPVSGTH